MIISVKDGKTPYIGSNGNWWIGSFDTGVYAQGGGGYGLGATTPVDVSDLNGITHTGWYRSNGNTPDGEYWYGMHVQYDEKNAAQDFRSVNGELRVTRYLTDGHWGNWMWDNPPMNLNVEYLTTEKYANGKEVFVKLLSFGSMPDNLFAMVPHNILNLGALISVSGHYGEDETNGTNLMGSVSVDVAVNKTYITINTEANYSSYNAYVLLKYTKA